MSSFIAHLRGPLSRGCPQSYASRPGGSGPVDCWRRCTPAPPHGHRRPQSERRRQRVQVARADPAQRHQHARDPERGPKGAHRDLAPLEARRHQPPHRRQRRAHPGESQPHPAHRRRQRDRLVHVARPERVGRRLHARGRLRARHRLLQRRQRAPQARGVEVRQQADGRARVRTVEPGHPRRRRELAEVGAVAPRPALPGRADRADLQPCLVPGFGRNVLLEGQLRRIAQLHLWARHGGNPWRATPFGLLPRRLSPEGRPIFSRARAGRCSLALSPRLRTFPGPPVRDHAPGGSRQKGSANTQRLGRLGGKVSAADRKGNSEWGRRAQRQRASRAQKRAYPGLVRLWALNAVLTRWGRPTVPLPKCGEMATASAARRGR